MKEKIFIFIAGVLVGAILATGVFCIIRKVEHNNRPQQFNQEDRRQFRGKGPMGDGEPQGMPERRGQDGNQGQGQRPELPSNQNNNNANNKEDKDNQNNKS